MAVIFDIETGPLDEAVLRERMPDFDESAVKCGNIKDPEKIAAKVAAAREEHEASWINKAALNATAGQVLVVGVDGADDNWQDWISEPEHEGGLLIRWWEFASTMHRAGRSIIGFNIHNFDLPFLVRRSWLLGVDVPDWIIDRGRYWHPTFVDLLEVWRLGARNEYIGQNALATMLGLPGKHDGLTGADFARLWWEDRPTAIKYVERDLEQISGIAEALQVV